MQKHSALLAITALISGVAVAAPPANAGLPAGTTGVTVTSGSSVMDVDGHLSLGGGVSGNVVRAAGGAGVPANVEVWLNGQLVAIGISDVTGQYVVHGLAPDGSHNFAICVRGDAVITSTSTGLLGSCYGGAAYNGMAPPGSAYTLGVSSGELVTSVDIALPKAAAIAGTVTVPGGAGLGGVRVIAHNRTTGREFPSETTNTGAYTITGLTPSTSGYTVCFDPASLGSGTGFLPRCYLNTAWDGVGGLPSSAQAIPVSLGHVHSGIDQRLARGGAISGTVHKPSGAPLAHVLVVAFSASGEKLAGTPSDIQGHYVLRGLSAALGDRVCVGPFDASLTVRYSGRCWRTASWNGSAPPAGADPVSVQVAATHTGINLTVGRTQYVLGTISGTIHQTAPGGPLQGADVYLFSNSGTQVSQTQSDVDGNYSFPNLRPSAAGYVVCVSTASSEPTPFSATGWESRCHTNTLWNGLTFAVPAAATRVPLLSGQSVSGVDVTLHPGGGIEGYVYSGIGTSVPLTASIPVYAFTPAGRKVTSTTTNPETGGYELVGLNPGTYIVCFDGRDVTSGGTPTGFQAQCFDNVAWTGNL